MDSLWPYLNLGGSNAYFPLNAAIPPFPSQNDDDDHMHFRKKSLSLYSPSEGGGWRFISFPIDQAGNLDWERETLPSSPFF